MVVGIERDGQVLCLWICTCSLNRGNQGLAPEIPVARRRWVEAQSQADNKYDEEDLAPYKGRPAWKGEQAEKWFRDITGKWIANESQGKNVGPIAHLFVHHASVDDTRRTVPIQLSHPLTESKGQLNKPPL